MSDENESTENVEVVDHEANSRLSREDLVRLLDYMTATKKLQDTFYYAIEIVEIDWEKEMIFTRRDRPRPLPASDEHMSFDFLERYWKLNHGEIEEMRIDLKD
jgi:hypothetical protein